MATITSISRATRLPKLARGSTAVVFLALLLLACAEEEEAAITPVPAPVCRAGRADALGFLLLLGRLGGGRLSGRRVSGRRLLLRGLLSG